MLLVIKKQLKDWVRHKVKSVPFDLGNGLLHVYRKLLGRRKKIYMEKKEAVRILTAIKNGNLKKAVVVYDRLSSPPTLGDFFCTVMLARYFASQGIPTDFIMVDGEYRKDWLNFDSEGRKTRGEDHQHLAKIMLNFEAVSVETLTWSEIMERLNQGKGEKGQREEQDVIFRNNVMSRSVVYAHVLNVLNHLLVDAGKDHLGRFLLSFSDFSEHEKISEPYITYHCRRSIKSTSLFRNTQDEEFIQIYSRLRELYPDYKILVLSDRVGFEYFEKLALSHGFDCLFSKQYSDSFFGDCGLLLKGAYHFTLRGGGIDMLSLFSKTPYEHFASPINDDVLSNGKATSWSTESQFYTDIKWAPELFLPSGNVCLDSGLLMDQGRLKTS